MSNVLDLADQAMFLAERSALANLLQCVWVYDRAIDIDGLARFHRRLQRGRLSRRVERSPLPFGRHRWVRPTDQPALELVSPTRSRAEFDAWLREQARVPTDSEQGAAGWRLAVLPFTDGGTGVSLVVSHCLTDGVGLCEALADAACGRADPVEWPAAASRSWQQAVREDVRQTARDARAIGRAATSAMHAAIQQRCGTAPATASPDLSTRPDELINVPATTVFVDADEWDARADALGGTSNALLVGLAARLADRAGFAGPDGSVTLAMPVNERIAGDTRANPVASVDITVEPARVTAGLHEVRAATKLGLIRHAEAPDAARAVMPLVPLVPEELARRMLLRVAAGGATSVVSSNLGAIDPATNRADGTEADYFAMTSHFPGVTAAMAQSAGGRLALLSGRLHGRVFISALAFAPDRSNTNDVLQQDVSGALADFSLSATTGWGCHELQTRAGSAR